MVKIRLKRVGKTKQPSYRVVVADSRSPRDGRIIEAIGHYNPRSEPSVVSIDTERAQYWIDRGAQTSEVVTKLIAIVREGGATEAPAGTPAAATAPKATPAASVKATPAASVSDDSAAEDTAAADEVTEEVPAGQEPAEVPEAEDQTAAAPDAKE